MLSTEAWRSDSGWNPWEQGGSSYTGGKSYTGWKERGGEGGSLTSNPQKRRWIGNHQFLLI